MFSSTTLQKHTKDELCVKNCMNNIIIYSAMKIRCFLFSATNKFIWSVERYIRLFHANLGDIIYICVFINIEFVDCFCLQISYEEITRYFNISFPFNWYVFFFLLFLFISFLCRFIIFMFSFYRRKITKETPR